MFAALVSPASPHGAHLAPAGAVIEPQLADGTGGSAGSALAERAPERPRVQQCEQLIHALE